MTVKKTVHVVSFNPSLHSKMKEAEESLSNIAFGIKKSGRSEEPEVFLTWLFQFVTSLMFIMSISNNIIRCDFDKILASMLRYVNDTEDLHIFQKLNPNTAVVDQLAIDQHTLA